MPQDDSSADLAADVTQGSGLSAWQLRVAVVRHYRLVYRVAYGLLMDAHEAEDVTQEAFLRLWQRGGSVRGTREWLLTVARNACLDRLRKRRDYSVAEPEEIDARSDERDPAWHFDQKDLACRLQALIGTLPEPQRSLIVLFDMHGQSGEACSRILGLSVNQVKVYLHRARRRLRRELEKSS